MSTEAASLALSQAALIQALFAAGDAQESALAALAPWLEGSSTSAGGRATSAFNWRGLNAYRANGHALAHRALAAAYPVTAQLIGEESFAALAKALWHAQPPQRGDLAQWGEALAAFMAVSPQLAGEPYLPDVARAEWLIHQCGSSADAEPDPGSLQRLLHEDPAGLRARLAPGCAGLTSAWPVASIVLAHQTLAAAGDPTDPNDPTDLSEPSDRAGQSALQEAGALVRAGIAQSCVVWRQGHVPRLRQALPAEVAWLAALSQGRSLTDALEAAGPAFELATWLPQAVSEGLLCGIESL